ncbi:sugar-binding protein [Chryseobacterium sp. HMWF028]|nr:sugar-binding protein [Chryseobacterium sp. HMWF028]
MKKLIIPIGVLLLSNITYAQLSPLPNTENYVQTKTYLDYNGTSATKSSETVQYFDGLGRPKQIVNVKASPLGKDVVIPIKYDQFGRQVQEYLPVPQGGTLNGAITPDPLSNVSSTPYGSEKIYSEKILENSPLDRIQQQIQVGTDWSTKPVKFEYDANGFNEVYQYITTTTWVDGATKSKPELSSATIYAPNQLYKNSVKDEDGNETIEFKNGRGQVVLVRKVLSSTEHIDTYYVYNEYDQLSFVIPPKAVYQAITDDLLNNLCYQYRYDGKGRLVEKKLPGKGWEYMVYDKADRIILSQDANLRKSFDWIISKYDVLGRPIYTGIVKSNNTRIGMQNQITGGAILEGRDNTPLTANGMPYYYTNMHWGLDTLLSVTYYDSYPQQYGFNPPVPSTILGEPVLTDTPTADGRSTKGLPVLSLVKNVEDDGWTKTYTYYDRKGRVIGTHSINHLGGYTHTESKLDFAGLPQQTITTHKRLASDTERVVTETFEYDNQNRVLVHKHQVDSNPVEILAQNKYNELSQLESKKVGGVTASSPLQQIDYKYNIRGWMTQINDPANLGNDLFGYKINYNKVEGLEVPNADYPNQKVTPKYNGNIAEVSWKTLTEDNEPLKRYGYAYDALNRLTGGFYQKDTNPYAKEYNELLAYDVNGNILNLVRTEGLLPGANTTLMIDNLKYDYVGNKLVKVKDEQQNASGYPFSIIPNTIGYDNDNGDGNGNMISHPDKGISSIQYNYLNLPKQITQNSKVTQYTYRADGVKVKKLFGDLETDYLDGFQYKSTFGMESWNGQGTYIPNPNEIPELKLRIIPTSEGYYDALLDKYIYNFTDHLGNVRLSYSDSNKDGMIAPRQYLSQTCSKPRPGSTPICISNWEPGEIAEVNNYYPFGMLHNYTATTQNAYQYKYQGQELQETGFYSFKWRNYMPDVGRFFNIDPLSEKYSYQSHYNFSENRVVDGRELEGLEVVLLKNSTYNNDIIGIANSGRYKDDPFTKTVHLFAHGNPKEFYNETFEGETTINSGAALNNVLMQGSELWKNSKDHEGFTVVIHACRTGRATTDEKGNLVDPVTSKISKSDEMEGVKLIAPTERDAFLNGKELGPRKTTKTDKNGDPLPGVQHKEMKVTSEKGSWNTFENGKNTEQHPGDWIPSGGGGIWNRVLF